MLNYLKRIIESDEVKSFKIHVVSGEEHTFIKNSLKISFSEDNELIIFKSNIQTKVIKIDCIESIIMP